MGESQSISVSLLPEAAIHLAPQSHPSRVWVECDSAPSERLAGGDGLQQLPPVCEAERQAIPPPEKSRRASVGRQRYSRLHRPEFHPFSDRSWRRPRRRRATPWGHQSLRRAGQQMRPRCRFQPDQVPALVQVRTAARRVSLHTVFLETAPDVIGLSLEHEPRGSLPTPGRRSMQI
jgi:hypothetical protein